MNSLEQVRASIVRKKSAVLLATLLMSTVAVAGSPENTLLEGKLQQLTNKGALLTYDQNDVVSFISTKNGQAIKQPFNGVVSDTPEGVAYNFLTEYAALFGTSYKPEYSITRTLTDEVGYSVKVRQSVQGIPVYAGEMVVRIDKDLQVTGVNGEVSSNLSNLSTKPKTTEQQATETAISVVEKNRKVDGVLLQTESSGLWVYNPKLIGEPGNTNKLVWKIEVTGGSSNNSVRELVLVDAITGAVSLSFTKIMHAKERLVYDSENIPNDDLPGTNLVRSEGEPSVNVDVDAAYDYSGDTYDFYKKYHGRDSLDGTGMPLISTVRFCSLSSSCPYQNAFWNGSQMTYGEGFAADDVVAHELTHGVTEFTSNLIYLNQSGAINESFSDIWGELVDLTNSGGTDNNAVRWELGEDIPGIGAIRNLKDPGIHGDPDKITSSNYYCGTSDNGGVHTNSGVGNKAAYLMVDGATFNGTTVEKIGFKRTAKIFYRAQTSYLTSGSTYENLYEALNSSCSDLIGTNNITATTCDSVKDALDAVEMNVLPCGAVTPVPAPVCPAGLNPTYLLNETFEQGLGKWTHEANTGSDAWALDNSNPYAGNRHVHADDLSTTSDSYIEMMTPIKLTSSSYLRFEHSLDTESTWDGGVIEYSTNNGSTWTDAGDLISENGYNGTLLSSSNPLSGREAYTGSSSGYLGSRLTLDPLTGDTVKFRFRMGSDSTVSAYGWDIDNIQLYNCDTEGPEVVTPAPGARITGFKRTFKWDNKEFDVSKSWLLVGTTPNGSEIARINTFRNTEVQVAGLPKDGSTIYVTLRTYYDGSWHAYKTTYVSSSKGFTEQFNGDISNWSALSGAWTNRANKYLFNRPADYQSVVYSPSKFADFDYIARVKRTGGDNDTSDTALIIRSDGNISASGACSNCYTFDMAKIQGVNQFSVWKVENGLYSALNNWEASSAIKDNDWNGLKVRAVGNVLKFYINGTEVWSGTDSTHSDGYVGVESYADNPPTDKHLLYVDWAKVVTNTSTTSVNESAPLESSNSSNTHQGLTSKFSGLSKWFK